MHYCLLYVLIQFSIRALIFHAKVHWLVDITSHFIAVLVYAKLHVNAEWVLTVSLEYNINGFVLRILRHSRLKDTIFNHRLLFKCFVKCQEQIQPWLHRILHINWKLYVFFCLAYVRQTLM